MSSKIDDILGSVLNKALALKKSEPDIKEPISKIELGNGYLLVHTHTNPPEVTDRGQGYSGVDFFEIRHPASEHVLAGLTGMAGEGLEPIIKIGVIVPDHKATGISKNIYDALVKKYGKCPEEALSFLRTTWGDQEEYPSVEEKHKIGAWSEKLDEVFKVLENKEEDEQEEGSLEKSFKFDEILSFLKGEAHHTLFSIPRTTRSHSKVPGYKRPIRINRIEKTPDYDPLFKSQGSGSYKKLKPMLPEPEHDHVVKWTAENISHPPMQSWFLRNYKKDNSIFNDDNKSTLSHYSGMTKIDDSFKQVDLGKHVDFQTGLSSFKKADENFANSKTHLVTEKGKKLIDFGNGMAWWNLKVSQCKEEGRAMGHCGNAGEPHRNDRIFSLRKEHKVGTKTYYEPMATFIHNKGFFGEMKGRMNGKPHKDTHGMIADLLSHPDIVGATGGKYASETDFHFDDLSPELQQKVKGANPNFVDIRSDSFSDEQKEEAIKKVPRVEKMQTAVGRHQRRKSLLSDLNTGKISPESLSHDDVSHVHDHHLVTPKQVTDAFIQLDSSTGMYLSRSNKLDVDRAVKENPMNTIAIKRRLKPHHVDHIVQNSPDWAAYSLQDILKPHHVDHIVQKAPGWAAHSLQDVLKPHHVDHIVQNAPGQAAMHLKDVLKPHHVDHIVQKKPVFAAELLKDVVKPHHVDHIVQEAPAWAAQYLHHMIQTHHIDHIVQDSPNYAVSYLRDRIQDRHVDWIVQNDPLSAARRLRDRLQTHHVDNMVQNAPETAANYLRDRIQTHHIDHIVQNAPKEAAISLHHLLQPHHVDTIIEKLKQPDTRAWPFEIKQIKPNLKSIATPEQRAKIRKLFSKKLKMSLGSQKDFNSLNKSFREVFSVLRKSEPGKSMIKVTGYPGWHELLNIEDTKIPAHLPGGGNQYTFKHSRTGEPITVHQDLVEDMDQFENLTKIQYLRKFKKKELLKQQNSAKSSYDLGDDYILTHEDSSTITPSPTDYWRVKKAGEHAADITVVHGKSGTPHVEWASVSREHKGKGLARRAYQKLADHYGAISSDEKRTPEATKAWKKIGALFERREGQSSNRFGRYVLRSPKIQKAKDTPTHTDKIPGGLADKKKLKVFSPASIEEGRKVEMEHTDDPRVATEIAMDHLTEDPSYYKKLKRIEKKNLNKIFSLLKSSERTNKLYALAGQTQTGVDPISGDKAFLLFRGMEKQEFKETVSPNDKVEAQHESVWTPFPDVAMKFSPNGYLVGAWISEKNLIIQSAKPSTQFDPELQKLSLYKIVVRPHNSRILDSDQTQAIINKLKPKSGD